MEKADIRRVQATGSAPRGRLARAGFDIVYVYGGHSYLLTQFLSPFYNKRTDEYGGSLENRARIWLETLEVVREAVGDDCADRRAHRRRPRPPGSSVDEALEFVRLADHLVDLWDVNVGSIAEWSTRLRRRRASSRRATSSNGRGGCARRPPSRSSASARCTNPDTMAEVVRVGRSDLIGAARPSIADPFLPRKIEEGRYDEIRECIGCNVCIAKVGVGSPPRLHAERDRGRGVPPRLASRALRAGGERGPRRARRRRRARRAWSARSCSRKRGLRRVHLVDAEAEIGGDHALDPAAARASASGAASSTGGGSSSTGSERRGADRPAAGRRRPCASTAPRSSSARPGPSWAPDGLNAVTHEPIPGADADAPARPDARAGHARGRSARPASASSSTTARATSRPPGSPSCSRSRATRSSS